MEVQIQDVGPWRKQLSITVPVETVEARMEKLVEGYRRRTAMPGFRRGKAPMELIRVQFQGSIESDLLNDLIPDAYREALDETKLTPVAPPKIHDIRFAAGQPLRFLADLEIQPQIEVTGYRDLEIAQVIFEADDKMIEEALEALRRGRAEQVRVQRPSEPGDVIQATLEPVDIHGKRIPSGTKDERQLEAGSSFLLPEFREASLGISAGEARIIEVHYPEDFRDRELAGKTRRFRVVAREILEKKMAELDDNFARSIEPSLDLEGLKAKIRLRLEAEELLRSKQRLEEDLLDRLFERNPFSVPEAMVAYRLERAIERAHEGSESVDEEGFRERFRPVVERVCRREILLDTVIRQESLAVTDEEMEAELDSMAQEAGVEVEVIRKKVEADGELDRIRDTMQERKILDFLLSTARVTRHRRPRPTEPENRIGRTPGDQEG